jgi:hypothetical protein
LALAESVRDPKAGSELALLDHHWMTPANMAGHKSKVYLSPEQSLFIRNEDRTGRYLDPVADLDPLFQGDWLAAWAPVEGTHWIAIVQERRDVALQPVGDLRNVFVRSGYIAIAVFSVMLSVFWLLLRRASE